MAINLATNREKFISTVNAYKDLNMTFQATLDSTTGRVTVLADYLRNVLSFSNSSATETVIYRSDTPTHLTHTYVIYADALANVEYNFVFESLLSSFTRLVQNWLSE